MNKTATNNYLIPVELNVGGPLHSQQRLKLKGSQVAEINKMLRQFEDENWREYGEAIYQ